MTVRSLAQRKWRWFAGLPAELSEGEALQRAATMDVWFTDEELNTILVALKLGRIRYGMLLQLAVQCERAVLPFEAIGALIDSIEGSLALRDGART